MFFRDEYKVEVWGGGTPLKNTVMSSCTTVQTENLNCCVISAIVYSNTLAVISGFCIAVWYSYRMVMILICSRYSVLQHCYPSGYRDLGIIML
jgi:hypothetical protein